MTKYEAFINARKVYSWAFLFGQGSLHQLTNWFNEIELNAHYPYDSFDRDRETQKFRSLVMAGANIEWEARPDLQIWVLRITWHYSK